MSTKPKRWLMTPAQRSKELKAFSKEYFGKDGAIFQAPLGGGYYGVEHDSKRGWLVFEFYDKDVDVDDEDTHAKAKYAWFNSEKLPKGYYALTPEVVATVFDNALRKWGETWLEEIDLSSVEEALQATLFGE